MFSSGDKRALMAAGSVPAFDNAVVDSLLAADLQAIEKYILEQNTGFSWHILLNNHASTRPPKYGGPLVHAVTKCKTFQKNEACSATSLWRCILQLPNSFQPDDGRRLEAVGEGRTKDDASEDACRKALAKLLYEEPSNVVLRPKHWKLPPDQLVASLPLSRGSHQALPVHISARQEYAGTQAAVLSESESADLVTDLIRLCLNTHGGEFDPSKMCHQKTGLGPEEERVCARLHRLLLPGELRDFIGRHPEFAWRAVNSTWRHHLGVCFTGMRIAWASVLPDSVGPPAPSSASAAHPAPTSVEAVPQYVEKPADNLPSCAGPQSVYAGPQSFYADMQDYMRSKQKHGGVAMLC